jgi:hypothetical protein
MRKRRARDVIIPHDPEEDERAQAEKEADEAARKRAWFEPALPPGPGEGVYEVGPLLPRLVHVQADEGWPELGRVPWEVHEAACRVLGKDAERVAARGGLAFGEVSAALGGLGAREMGWRGWG